MTKEEAREAIKEAYGNSEYTDEIIKALEQEPCEDAISRQWLMECVNEGWIKFDTEKDENRFIHLVRDMAPPVTPQPKTGHWIPTYGNVKCSACGHTEEAGGVGKATHYCSFCGADMREVVEE